MKNRKSALLAMLPLAPVGSFAKPVPATSYTLDSAEAVIAQKAKEVSASGCIITSARMDHTAAVNAVLNK
jgi:hypothetical protein